ncbi:hypothetical protein Tco_1016439, partial [Tanacetum coccineum]
MDEQTMRGWLNDLQDRFDTLWLNDLQDRFTLCSKLWRNSGPQSFSSRVMRSRLLFGNKNNQAVNTIAGDQEDPDVKDKQENQDDLNIAVLDQVLEESIIHTSDKVEAVPTSMVATYEEQGCQESVSGSGIYESGISGLVPQLRDAKDEPYQAMLDAAALKAKSNL